MARGGHAPTSSLERALRELRPGFAMLVLFSCGINVLILSSPLYMWQIYDRVPASGRVETMVFLTLITAAAPGERLVLLTDRHYVSARSVSNCCWS